MGTQKTKSGIMRLVRPHLRELVGYTGVQPVDKVVREAETEGREPVSQEPIKLDGNENPYGPSPRLQQIVGDDSFFHLYPDPDHRELRAALSEYVGVGPEHIVVGNGADEILDLVARLLLEPEDKVINCPPTFGMYRFIVDICGAREVDVARTSSYDLDIDAIQKAIDDRTKIVFVTSPNNPTGNSVTDEEIVQLLDTGVAVVVDEAYYEFCGQSVVPLVTRYDNLMVIRTFSKWAGLAGVRIGYGAFSPNIAAYLSRIKMPYNLSVFAQRAALESLKDRDYLMGNVEKIKKERERMYAQLSKLDFLHPIPSHGNYILCQVLKGDARRLYEQLQQRRILIRYFDTQGLRNFVRISAGKPEHTDAVVEALRSIGEELDVE
ncbi:MAG: histidinol-phosphate transaminase [Dehalococcoidia bacterium]